MRAQKNDIFWRNLTRVAGILGIFAICNIIFDKILQNSGIENLGYAAALSIFIIALIFINSNRKRRRNKFKKHKVLFSVLSVITMLFTLAYFAYKIYYITNESKHVDHSIINNAENSPISFIDKKGYIKVNQTDIKNESSYNGYKIATKYRGDRVYVIEQNNENKWYRVRFDNEFYGYVPQEHISFDFIERKYTDRPQSYSQPQKQEPVIIHKTSQESPRNNTANNEVKKPEIVQYGKVKIVNKNSFDITLKRTNRSTMKKKLYTIQRGYWASYNFAVGEYLFEVNRDDKNTLIETFYLSINVNKEITKDIIKINTQPKANTNNAITTKRGLERQNTSVPPRTIVVINNTKYTRYVRIKKQSDSDYKSDNKIVVAAGQTSYYYNLEVGVYIYMPSKQL